MKKLNYTSAERVDLVPLNVRALNLKSGEFQSSIVVPDGKYLRITLADKFDTEVGSVDEVSAETSQYAARHGRRRTFLLVHAGRVVGWAELHRAVRDYTLEVPVRIQGEVTVPVTVSAKSEGEAIEKAEEIAKSLVDGNLDEFLADNYDDFDVTTYLA